MAEEDAAPVLYVEDEPAVLELGVSASLTAATAVKRLSAPELPPHSA
jgi:hypothetical protein